MPDKSTDLLNQALLNEKRKQDRILQILCLCASDLVYLKRACAAYDLEVTEDLEETKNKLKKELDQNKIPEIQNLYDDLKDLEYSLNLVKLGNTSRNSEILKPKSIYGNSILFELFNFRGSDFLYNLVSVFNRIRISLNPETNLTFDELKSSIHSDLFNEAAKTSKTFNKFYRDYIAKGFTENQILHNFFKLIKDKSIIKCPQELNRLFKLAERKILKGKKFIDNEIEHTIADKIYDNLTKVSEFTFEAHEEKSELVAYKNKIETVRSIIKFLVKQIQFQQLRLDEIETQKQELLKNQELNKIDNIVKSLRKKQLIAYNFIQDNKRKLYHFMLKTESWTQGNTLSQEKHFDYTYIQKQFDKFPDQAMKIDYVVNNDPEKTYELRLNGKDNDEGAYKFNAKLANKGILKLFKPDEKSLQNEKNIDGYLIEIQKNQLIKIEKVINEMENMLSKFNVDIINQRTDLDLKGKLELLLKDDLQEPLDIPRIEIEKLKIRLQELEEINKQKTIAVKEVTDLTVDSQKLKQKLSLIKDLLPNNKKASPVAANIETLPLSSVGRDIIRETSDYLGNTLHNVDDFSLLTPGIQNFQSDPLNNDHSSLYQYFAPHSKLANFPSITPRT